MNEEKKIYTNNINKIKNYINNYDIHYVDNNNNKLNNNIKNLNNKERYIYNKDEHKEIINIQGIYKKDYNILEIHDIIIKQFKWERNKYIKFLINKKNIIKKLLKNKLTNVERINYSTEIQEIKTKIEEIKSGNKIKSYYNLTKTYLEQYKQIGTISNIVYFGDDNDNKEEESYEKSKLRHDIIKNYINIAKNYININIIQDTPKGLTCNSCDYLFDSNIQNIDNNGIIVCPICFTEKIVIVNSPFYKDSVRVSNSRNNYEDRVNFQKALRRYQGKQINIPPISLYKELDIYFINKQDIINKYKSKSNVTLRDMMFSALYETNNSIYYDDINLILFNYWGWPLTDLSYIEDKIMKDYDLTQKIYNNIPKKRKSSLNSQFRLFKHLQRFQKYIKKKIISSDFKIPTTRTILEWHEDIWDIIISKAGPVS